MKYIYGKKWCPINRRYNIMSNADNASFVQHLCKQIALALLTKCIVVTLKWARWRLQSPVPRLFTQPFVQVQNMENVSIWWRHHVVAPINHLIRSDLSFFFKSVVA